MNQIALAICSKRTTNSRLMLASSFGCSFILYSITGAILDPVQSAPAKRFLLMTGTAHRAHLPSGAGHPEAIPAGAGKLRGGMVSNSEKKAARRPSHSETSSDD